MRSEALRGSWKDSIILALTLLVMSLFSSQYAVALGNSGGRGNLPYPDNTSLLNDISALLANADGEKSINVILKLN